MRNILVIGAGRSTSSLISYLLEKSSSENLSVIVADRSFEAALQRTADHPNGKAMALDIQNEKERKVCIQNADIVVSMLPARFHMEIANDCLTCGKHMVTASYISAGLQQLDTAVKRKGLVFMNEIGLDPGIDHMSAMEAIDRIRDHGGKLIRFESFSGGLVAPESDTNLWHYKFTWNPRNVVIAGQGGAAKFIQNGAYKYIPYHRLFRRTEFMEIPGYGKFEAYANRDSLKYRNAYGLENAATLYRGTIRRVGFSKAWNVFVQLGMTDDSYVMEGSETMSYREFTNSFLPYNPYDSVELKLRYYLKIDQDDILWEKLLELELFNPTKKVGLKNATPARILQKILMDSWTLNEVDKDMIVMYHKFAYSLQSQIWNTASHMVVVGNDSIDTAMAKTVGLPVAMAALHILNGTIRTPGVQIPVSKETYIPVLKELRNRGIFFNEQKHHI